MEHRDTRCHAEISGARSMYHCVRCRATPCSKRSDGVDGQVVTGPAGRAWASRSAMRVHSHRGERQHGRSRPRRRPRAPRRPQRLDEVERVGHGRTPVPPGAGSPGWRAAAARAVRRGRPPAAPSARRWRPRRRAAPRRAAVRGPPRSRAPRPGRTPPPRSAGRPARDGVEAAGLVAPGDDEPAEASPAPRCRGDPPARPRARTARRRRAAASPRRRVLEPGDPTDDRRRRRAEAPGVRDRVGHSSRSPAAARRSPRRPPASRGPRGGSRRAGPRRHPRPRPR